MKHGRKPKMKQKIIIKNVGLNPDNWLIVKKLPGELWIVHKVSGKQRVINL